MEESELINMTITRDEYIMILSSHVNRMRNIIEELCRRPRDFDLYEEFKAYQKRYEELLKYWEG